jgi:hypothetical protein
VSNADSARVILGSLAELWLLGMLALGLHLKRQIQREERERTRKTEREQRYTRGREHIRRFYTVFPSGNPSERERDAEPET